MSKRKLQVLSLSDKLKIVNAFESGKERQEILIDFDIAESTYYKIMKSKELIKSQCSEGHGNMKRSRLSKFPNIEKSLLEWIKQTIDQNIPIDGPLLKQKSLDFATKLKIQNFSASNGWLEGFKKRNHITFTKAAGECKSVDQEVSNKWTEDDIVENCVSSCTDGNESENEASQAHILDREVEEIPTRRDALKALETLRKFYQYTVVDQTILDKIDELETYTENLTETQTKITDFFSKCCYKII